MYENGFDENTIINGFTEDSERNDVDETLDCIIQELSSKTECSCLCSYVKDLKVTCTWYYKIHENITAMTLKKAKAMQSSYGNSTNSGIINAEIYSKALKIIYEELLENGFPEEMASDFKRFSEYAKFVIHKKNDFSEELKKSIHLFHPSVTLLINNTYHTMIQKIETLLNNFTL